MVVDPTLTVNQFCAAEKISRSQLYDLWKQKKGPDYYLNGKCRRITYEARVRWQRQREAEARALAQSA